MRQALIAANWKTHGSLSFVDSFCAQLASELSDVTGPDVSGSANDVVICPPAVYVQVLGAALAADLGSVRQIGVGAQDIGISATGAHTGELAAEMVADTGGQWAIVGHSERRLDQGETDDLVATKAAAALRGGLRPIVCVGETLQERQAGQEIAVLRSARI